MSITKEERREAYESFYRFAEGYLARLFQARAMLIDVDGEEAKEKVDKWIIETSEKYRKKYDNMSSLQLRLIAVAELIDNEVDISDILEV